MVCMNMRKRIGEFFLVCGSIILAVELAVVAVVLMWPPFGNVLRSWAVHRSEPPVPRPVIEPPGCDIGEVGVHDAITELHGGSRSFESYLFAGDWNFIGEGLNPFCGSIDGTKDSNFTVTKHVGPGANVLEFRLRQGQLAREGDTGSCVFSQTCTYKYSVTGIAGGEPFEVIGPCVVEKDVEIEFALILTGDDIPFSLINNGGPSELNVRRKLGGSFDLHQFKFQGQLVSSGTQVGIENGGGVAVTFVDDGLYEIEVVWKMPTGPDGVNIVEVSRAKKKVVVGDPGSVASSLGVTEAQLMAEVSGGRCSPGADCLSGNAVAICPAFGDLGEVVCLDGKLRVKTFGDKILKEAMECLNTQDTTKAAKLTEIFIECTEEHEKEHISWFSHNDPDACKGLCCGAIPEFPGKTDNDRVNNCKDSERDAYNRDIQCFQHRLDQYQQGVISLSPEEEKCVKKFKKDSQDRIDQDIFENCGFIII